MVLPCIMTALNNIGGRCFGWISEEAGHIISYGDNIENLMKQVQNLSDTINTVEARIEEAENARGATRVNAVVERLLERMASVKEEASKIIIDDERSSDCTCLIRLRPNLWACYLISKSARKAINEAVELLEEGKKLDKEVCNVDYSKCLGVTPNPDFEELESRALASKQIVEALKDPKVHKVGVYGMGGAGKTTLAVKIGAELHLNGTFSYVVLATVSEKQNNNQSDLISIQEQIAGGLKVKLQGTTLNDRATELREQLQKRDKLLIILDDIWSKFELEMVGIPVGSDFTTKFKILMTSRNKLVLENGMDSTNNFGLDSLPRDDAQNLFDKMIGGEVQYSKWPFIAHQVVDLCGGIPILLVTIGKTLRNATRGVWEDALTQLKQFDGEDDIDEEAYKKIEVSYNFLKNEEMKKLFLLCAQLDHRYIRFDELLRYSMGLDLFKGRITLKQVSGRMHKYLRDLKGGCLLQDGNEEGIIKMHDVVHKFASVANRDRHLFSVANDGELEVWPSKEQFAHYSAISFYRCRLPSSHELPVVFDNPNIESFLMLRSEIDESFQIPDNFFVGMKELKLMNLTLMSLSSGLVSSLSVLLKLRTLCLDGCKLSDVSVVGDLPMLQALSLQCSSIIMVPKEIGKLGSTLKLLDLRGCMELETIASGVISRLTLLEDLLIGYSFSRWQRLDDGDKSRSSVDETDEVEVASLEEFKNLQNLINLEINIQGLGKLFPKDLVFKKLETFEILFESFGMYDSHHIMLKNILAIKGSSTIVEFDSEGIQALKTIAENLLLEGVMSCVSVSEMDPKGFPELKHLQIKSGEIHYIVTKNYNNCIFPKLEMLSLERLHQMEKICDDHHDDPLPVGSFENLRVINVTNCKLLKDLLSSNFATTLLCLREIKIKECEIMESIIVSRESENEEEIQIGFPHQLQILELDDLPSLVSFYSFKQLEALPSSTPLFNKKIMFPNLEVLILSWLKIEKIWDDRLAITVEGTCWFQNLTSLEVSKCDNLRYLFTFSMVKSLVQLKQLEVRNCVSIEEIIASTERETTGDAQLSFPMLDKIRLDNLPNLKRFCQANLLECQLWRKLVIQICSELTMFMSTNDSSSPDHSTTLFSEKVTFSKLEVLKLSFIKVEKIWDDHLAITAEGTRWLQNLTTLKVSDCDTLRYLFTSSMAKSLAQLKQFEVSDCESIEEIVVSSRERETTEDIQLSFPKLGKIKLKDLPNLKRFCQDNLLECQLLQKLVIKNCPELETFISANDSSSQVAFPNLEELKIADCESLEKVFDIHRRTCGVLRSVYVSFCPSLASISPASLQQLERLSIEYCDKIDLFGSSNTEQQNNASAKLISNLEYCYLRNEVVTLKKEDQRLKLTIDECGFQVPPILFALHQTFLKLDEVEVSSDSIIQLFPCKPSHLADAADGDDMDTHAKTPVLIGLLKLVRLPNMKQIWSEHYPLKYDGIPEELQVAQCDNLLSLTPPFATLFKYLTKLVVHECPMLVKLVASSSIAKSLVNLEEMIVTMCNSLEEIVGIDGQWDELANNDEHIVFEKLECLHLQDLNSLTSFSTSDCNFRFPSLNMVVVMNCPKMKFFSKGALSTPELIRVDLDMEDEGEVPWEGDLNSTVRQLFEGMKKEEEDDHGDEHGEENKDEEVSEEEDDEE